ncbi:hypothetical protein SAXI111661_05560 [Saccharomonospora xinjiangensis]|uniref:hypothetical protein n=1 Tax=Saccharomonospora xinjiangensis TaxID=75294 RepID=UPI00106F7910|nr:hypothetical protein [Saccharomonospora xinjiangensis]QBQ58829.1 hypothetical protein EYD13_02230 [Saccharomonospora xinjiangensis]
MSDPLGSIKVEGEDSYGKKLAESLPVVGDAVKAYNGYSDAKDDGDVTASELRGIATDGANFISSCSDVVSDFATDPIGWLVGQGLDFLISIIQPLQDLIHLASGDGPALSKASENFQNIAEGISGFADQFSEESRTALSEWNGGAAEAAAARFGDFTKGIRAVAGDAGNIAQLLKISSMVMTVIEEFIKALLTEFVTWLIMIWIPALAAAIPTAGASTAAAGAATGVRAAQTGSRAAKQVNWLRKLLDKIQELLSKLRSIIAKQGDGFRQAMSNKRMRANLAKERVDSALADGTKASWRDRLNHAETGMVGERVTDGFVRSMKEATIGFGEEQIAKPGIRSHVNDAKTAHEAGDVGEDQATEKTSRQLDF